jgi:16S rRNA (adenine1518-N6/adenine1519-N6)-dimethyltransferase
VGRRFGQHFLARKSIIDRIADAACDAHAPTVIEIGPGRGALTEALLERSERVIAIEVDPVLVHYLQQKFRDALEAGRLELIQADVLKADLAQLGGGRAVIAGNLPYYITSPILERVFQLGEGWQRAVFLVQLEVAARLAADPGSRDYGYLSVLTQVHAKPEILAEVPRAAFRPPPKVDSAVVRLVPRDAKADFGIADKAAFLRFASECFRHKRKTLRNNLAPIYGRERADAIAEGRLRAEQLSITQLAALRQRLEKGSAQ